MKKLEFKNVYGYQEVKDELNLIKSWYEDESIINNDKITLPKGILFHGDPGNGKTLFVREFLSNFDCPKFVIEKAGDISEAFAKAREEKFAIIVIDELELLIEGNKEQRKLQLELDGLVQKGRVLVIATTNNLFKIDSPLKRPGRFDKLIRIEDPDRESRKTIFENMLLDLDADISNVNFEHVAKHCRNVCGADIKAICNDVFLRCGKKQITEDEIEYSYERITQKLVGSGKAKIKDYRVAIHEAGHALMALHYKKNWSFYKAKFTDGGGITESEEVNENFTTLEKRTQFIKIGFGGYVAEKVMFGKHDYGCYDDFEKIHDYCRRLVERTCIHGLNNHITSAYDSREYHRETESIQNRIERLTYKTMMKYEKEVKRFLVKHKDDLTKFANLMLDKGYVGYRDIPNLNLSNI